MHGGTRPELLVIPDEYDVFSPPSERRDDVRLEDLRSLLHDHDGESHAGE